MGLAARRGLLLVMAKKTLPTQVKPSIASAIGFAWLSDPEQADVAKAFAALEPRQQRFIIEYLTDLNATQAAIRAGYSKRTASEQSTRLRARFAALLTPLLRAQQAQLAEASGVSRQRWLREIQRCAFYSCSAFYDAHGNTIDIPALSEAAAAAVVGFEIVEGAEGKGYVKKYKLVDKLPALKLYGTAVGYLTEKVELTGPDGNPIQYHLTVEFV